MTASKQPTRTPRKRTPNNPRSLTGEQPVAGPGLTGHTEGEALTGEFIGKAETPEAAGAQALVALNGGPEPDEDEAVIERVEHLSHGVGWVLISAGVVGLVVPGVLGTPFLIMGALALWPGNHKRVERWRQGHSPKAFHGAMKQINRFLDDLEKRYPRNRRP